MAVDLLVDKYNAVKGVITFNEREGEFEAVLTNAVIIATGGIGQLYKYSTSRPVATGDGIYLAKKQELKLKIWNLFNSTPQL